MADRYWVGGTDTWNGTAGTKWALTSGGAGGQAVPTSADDVYFNAASGTVTATIGASVSCKSLNCTGFTGTLAGSSNLTVAGSVTLAATMTVTYTGTLTITGTGTIISAGKTIGPLTINASGGTVTLGDALDTSILYSITMSQGTFTTNNYNVSSRGITSSTSNLRTLNLGSSTLTLRGISPFSISSGTNFTFNAGTSSIITTNNNLTITSPGLTFYNFSITNASASHTSSITGTNTFNNFAVTGPSSVGVNQITFTSAQTINGTFSTTGTAGNRRVWFRSATTAIARNLVVNGTTSLTDADFRDLYVTGTAAPISGTRIGDLRGCSGITFSAPKTVYWNFSAGGNWSSDGWASATGGGVNTDNFPLPQDTGIIENTGLNNGGFIFLSSAIPYMGSIDMSSRTIPFSIVVTAVSIYGNWINGSGTAHIGTNVITFSGRNTQTISTAGKTLSFPITVDSYGGTVELSDALTSSNGLTLTNGTFDTKNYAVSVSGISSDNSNVRELRLGSSSVSVTVSFVCNSNTNFTFSAGTSTITTGNGFNTFPGVPLTFNNFVFGASPAATIIIAAGTVFNNLTITPTAASSGITQVPFGGNCTVTGTLTASTSTPVKRIFLRSNTLSSARILTINSLSATNCDFRDITIAGAAAGSSPTRAGDCGGNSNITFPAAKTVYWNLAGTQNWTSVAWAPSSGGTPALDNFPLAQDTVVFDNAGAAGTVSVNQAWNIGTFDASARTSAMTLTADSNYSVYGDWKFGSGVTQSITGTITFGGRGTQTITSNGKTFGCAIQINCVNGNVQLADAFVCSVDLGLVSGEFNAGSYAVTARGFSSSVTSTRTLKMGSATWTLTGPNAASNVWSLSSTTGLNFYKETADIVLSDTSTSARTFDGGGLSYNKLTIGGTTGISTLTITGNNQFTELASTKTVAHTISLGTTIQTFGKWSVTGTAGNVVTVTGTGISHQIVGSRVQGVDYLAMGSIGFSTTSPGEFYAGANSTGSSATIIKTAAPAARTLYWVGGTGNWNDTARWSTASGGGGGAALPTSVDAVIFNAASNATAYTSTVNATSRCGSLTIAGPASGNVTLAGGGTLIAHDNITLPSTGLTRTYSGSIILSGSTTGKTFTTNGVALTSSLTINGIGCEWSLGSNLGTNGVVNGIGSIFIVNGSFNTANFYCGCSSFESSNSNSRTITLGSSLVSTGLQTAINFTNSTNLSFNAGTSTVRLGTGGGALTLNGGSQTFYNAIFNTSLASNVSNLLTGNNTFNNLTFTCALSGQIGFVDIAENQTINGTLTVTQSSNATARTFIRSNTIGTTRTLTVNAISALQDIDFRDIAITGAAAPVSGTRFGDCKGNSGITFPAAKTVYRRGFGNDSWSDSNTWSDTIGGTGNNVYFPLAQDIAVFSSSYPNNSTTVTINGAWNIGTIDMSARTNTMTLNTSSSLITVYGDWINGTGIILSGSGLMTFAGRNTQTITSVGKSFTQQTTINSPNGSVILQDAYTNSYAGGGSRITLTSGTINGNNYNFTLSGSGAGGGLTLSGTLVKTVVIGSGTWLFAGNGNCWEITTSTNSTVTGTGTIRLTSTGKNFVGGGLDYSGITLDQAGSGTLTITGNNTFANITNSYKTTGATTIALGTTTQRVSRWTAGGEAGRLLTVTGTSAASPGTVILTGNTAANVDYLNISNVRAYPLQDKWYAGTTSTNSGSLGWIFSSDVSDLKNIYYSSANPVEIYYGSTFVSAIYYGDSIVWRTRPPITFVASSTGESSGNEDFATVTVSTPTGVIAGDLMIAVMTGGSDSQTWTGGSGWTEIADQAASPNLRIAYRIASGGGGGHTFTISDGVNKAATIVAYRNATYAQIGSFSTVATSGAAATAPAINVASENSLLLACFGTNNGSAFTTPSGMSSVVVFNSSVNPAVGVFSQQVGSGSTGSKSSDPSGSGNVSGILLALGRA